MNRWYKPFPNGLSIIGLTTLHMYTRKSPFLVDKLRISIAISNSYVKLLEGMSTDMLKYRCVLAWTYD